MIGLTKREVKITPVINGWYQVASEDKVFFQGNLRECQDYFWKGKYKEKNEGV